MPLTPNRPSYCIQGPFKNYATLGGGRSQFGIVWHKREICHFFVLLFYHATYPWFDLYVAMQVGKCQLWLCSQNPWKGLVKHDDWLASRRRRVNWTTENSELDDATVIQQRQNREVSTFVKVSDSPMVKWMTAAAADHLTAPILHPISSQVPPPRGGLCYILWYNFLRGYSNVWQCVTEEGFEK